MNKNYIKSVKFRHMATVGYVGLFLTLLIWKVIMEKNPVALVWLVPLAFPAAGIAKQKPYTFAWTGFISGAYVAHAMGMLFSSENLTDLRFALFEALFSLCFFFGAVYYIKFLHLYKEDSKQVQCNDFAEADK